MHLTHSPERQATHLRRTGRARTRRGLCRLCSPPPQPGQVRATRQCRHQPLLNQWLPFTAVNPAVQEPAAAGHIFTPHTTQEKRGTPNGGEESLPARPVHTPTLTPTRTAQAPTECSVKPALLPARRDLVPQSHKVGALIPSLHMKQPKHLPKAVQLEDSGVQAGFPW